ncbi:MAG: hypothetical protein COV74_08745 [Candidatus Omnitrophica bacterium CG11_big_fil_rev_8_21_14_0_20_45_26]|uniref:Membrane transport protein MMPL domain-containing protein n=1 Tax=Candidatus Abzuiibacterium crystallinum TaxID=1974748 RepID=A0A2H0LME3_9BACT|nr:MAG: hypothetical protein COV74_08745 [Candidatus Omnitrophica bacterium CG11_big_fil_rev_8_21_14_0_20_45_26]PIW63748.1 MAG: hypothetical protein COW12_09630 [Candidatus Omnitrophica bacterium CG12_big_fil_rev_8_21_14_0_65_45_16]
MNLSRFKKEAQLRISHFLEQEFLIPLKRHSIKFSAPILVGSLFTIISFTLFVSIVNLKPQIGENFFFSSHDPQMQEEKEIQKLFAQQPQLIISAKGPVESDPYLSKVKTLSDQLISLEEVISVQSISNGPGNMEKAQEGPLWSRVLVSKDGKSTLIILFIKKVSSEELIPKIENIVKQNNADDFELMISGEPYITELLRRSLFQDLKVFTLAAFVVFGAILIFVFRSIRILFGTLLTCLNAGMITLIISQVSGIATGPLTANLSTIVFVLTLSHMIFLTFNWKQCHSAGRAHPSSLVLQAIQMTFQASFWSMLTTFLGFWSLQLVKAEPLRQLGAAGAIGTAISFLCAYLIFPMFLVARHTNETHKNVVPVEKNLEPFFYRRHTNIFFGLTVVAFFLAFGLFRLNTDPSLLAYFKVGTPMREGLEYIDQNGGSSPLFIAVEDSEQLKFNQRKAYEKLWDVTEALEEDQEVGSAVSLPILLAQAQTNVIARVLTMEWLIDLLETERFGKAAKYFVTEDREKALLMLRMRETGRQGRRTEIIKRLENIVTEHKLKPFLLGGVYSLQGRMAKLVTSSLISGMILLLGLFICMSWFLSRSVKISFAMFFSLAMIPATVLGFLGYCHIPLDVIAAPAVNISIGIAVDAMIHLLLYVRRNYRNQITAWLSWREASAHLWRPILYTSVIIGAGFGIFALSQFPPTQRFGVMVLLGAVTTPLAALVVFIFITTVQWPKMLLKIIQKS